MPGAWSGALPDAACEVARPSAPAHATEVSHKSRPSTLGGTFLLPIVEEATVEEFLKRR